MNARGVFLLAVFSLVFVGCKSVSTSSRYPITSTGIAKELDKGTIIDVREVVIDAFHRELALMEERLEGAQLGAKSVRI